MEPNLRKERILAIALRSQRLGFAVIEGSVELLHWGMIHYKRNEKQRVRGAARRIAILFARFVPSVVAIEKSAADVALNPSGPHSLYHIIRKQAVHQSVPVCLLNRIKVREAFCDFGVRSKDDIAALLARMFPELQPKLPPKRKVWEPEHFSMPLFDAVALAIACWRNDRLKE